MPQRLILALLIAITSSSVVSAYEVATDYFSLGGSVFSPSGYNIVAKYNQRTFNYSLSGMYFHPYFGVESSVDFNLFNTTTFRNGPGIFAAYAQQKSSKEDSAIYNAFGENTPYVGVRYFWDWGVLNGAFGLGYGFDAKPFVFPVFNLGAKFDFIDSKRVFSIRAPEPRLFRESRDPILAAVLCLFPGGGYYYLGDWFKGAIATVLGLGAEINMMGMGYIKGTNSPWFIGASVVWVGIELFTIVDSVSIALNSPQDEEGKNPKP